MLAFIGYMLLIWACLLWPPLFVILLFLFAVALISGD